MKTFSGGADRDWVTDGCAATVEVGSNCYGTGLCGLWTVTYQHGPTQLKCSDRGGILYSNGSSGGGFFEETVYHYKCATCGAKFKRDSTLKFVKY